MTPHSKTEILSQTIWDKFITIDRKMVCLPLWHQAGASQISDLFDEHKNCFLPFCAQLLQAKLQLFTLSWSYILNIFSHDALLL